MIRINTLKTLVFLLTGLTGLNAQSADPMNDVMAPVIKIGGDFNYPPYEFIDDQGNPSGYNVELTQEIAKVMGMKVVIELGDWPAMRKKLNTGKIDVLQGMIFSEERNKTLDFSPPHAIVHQSIFARKNEGSAKSLSDLRHKEVIVQEGGIMADYLVQNNLDARLFFAKTHADALRMLASGKHDFALVANLPGLYLGKELNLANIVPVGKPFQPQQYGYAVVKGREDLLSQFSEGLAILKNTGKQQEIYNKWLGPLQQSGFPWKSIGQTAAIISGVLFFILGGTVIWSRALKRKVDQRTEELHLHQKQLIQADKMTSLGILVSGVAHEINNPVGLLLLNLPVLSEAWQDYQIVLDEKYTSEGDFLLAGLPYSRMRDEIPALLDDMQNGATKIKRIVNDLKDFARQDTEDLHQPIDLNEITETSIRLMDKTIRQSTNHFVMQLKQNLPLTQGNAQRIEQVIINLISNACQALNNTEKAIRIKSNHNEHYVTLIISDEGCGIDPENLLRISDPFYTTKRDLGGTGLGLSVSSGIISAHNGQLDFKSTPGKGTKVTMSLPILENHNP